MTLVALVNSVRVVTTTISCKCRLFVICADIQFCVIVRYA